MILTYEKIDEMATSLLYNLSPQNSDTLDVLPIERIIKDYLKFKIKYVKLSDSGDIYGLTAYANTECLLKVNGRDIIVPLKSNEILIDSRFITPYCLREHSGKHRFTLAHECAHQIIFGLESAENRAKYKKLYSTRTIHTAKQLQTANDWCEWQANVLGAALLMPKETVELFMWHTNSSKKLTSYQGCLHYHEREKLRMFCKHFGVSKTAAIIRLKHLGYIVEKPISEYINPVEVIYD